MDNRQNRNVTNGHLICCRHLPWLCFLVCFGWKKEGEEGGPGGTREVLLLGGDIHCGVTSVIRDKDTGMLINHLTTSPVTNHVCKFFPPLQGAISERYNFSHLPLGHNFRNYADISISILEDFVSVSAQLVPISTDMFKDPTYVNHSFVQNQKVIQRYDLIFLATAVLNG